MANLEEFSTHSGDGARSEPGRDARLTLRHAFTGSLATLDSEDDYPFVSLVGVATAPSGDVLLLLSGLARHTKNLNAASKASVLVETAFGGGDPMAGARLTVQGDVVLDSDEQTHQRYLARHPEAAHYAEFADFKFYRLGITRAHFIAGFGRIHSYGRETFCLHGSDERFALDSKQRQALGSSKMDDVRAAWRAQIGSLNDDQNLSIAAVDGDGVDVRSGDAIHRLDFTRAVASLEELEAAGELPFAQKKEPT